MVFDEGGLTRLVVHDGGFSGGANLLFREPSQPETPDNGELEQHDTSTYVVDGIPYAAHVLIFDMVGRPGGEPVAKRIKGHEGGPDAA